MNIQNKTKTLVGVGILTAIIIVLQVLAVVLPVYPFTLNLSLVPIVVGAALYGWWAGAWLGLVSGVVILINNAGAFLAFNVPGTVVTVLLKGILSGLLAGVVFKALENKNIYVATVAAAITAPVANTGIFALGCKIFFMPLIKEWLGGAGVDDAAATAFIFTGLIGVNFFIELGVNIILSTVLVRVIKYGKKSGQNNSIKKEA